MAELPSHCDAATETLANRAEGDRTASCTQTSCLRFSFLGFFLKKIRSINVGSLHVWLCKVPVFFQQSDLFPVLCSPQTSVWTTLEVPSLFPDPDCWLLSGETPPDGCEMELERVVPKLESLGTRCDLRATSLSQLYHFWAEGVTDCSSPKRRERHPKEGQSLVFLILHSSKWSSRLYLGEPWPETWFQFTTSLCFCHLLSFLSSQAYPSTPALRDFQTH